MGLFTNRYTINKPPKLSEAAKHAVFEVRSLFNRGWSPERIAPECGIELSEVEAILSYTDKDSLAGA